MPHIDAIVRGHGGRTGALFGLVLLLASLSSPSRGELANPVCEPGTWTRPAVDDRSAATSLGSIAIGDPDAGSLFNAVQLPPSRYWTIRDPGDSWATSETIAGLKEALFQVHREFPSSPPVCMGDLSDEDGGHLDRHISHQSGRDADIGWYFKDGARFHFFSGTSSLLDLPRSWALVRAFAMLDDTEMILIDRAVQRRLYRHAISSGEEKGWLDSIFQVARGGSKALIRHAPGHKNHLHVRLLNPCARARWSMYGEKLVEAGLIPDSQIVRHRVRSGESLWSLSRKYGTTVLAIAQANGLKSSAIRAGKVYVIPAGGR